MSEEGKKYLLDVRKAITLIEEFTKDTTAFVDFEKDFKTQSAVERQLAIIGEALNKFRKEEPEAEIENQAKIIAMRNRLVHAYDAIDASIVWVVIKRHLPKLKQEVQGLVE